MNENLNNKKSNGYYFKLYEVIIMVVATCFLSFFAGSTIMELKINKDSNSSITKKVKDDKYLTKFIENYNYVIENYYKDIDKDELINGAIEGMMGTLDDPYTTYMDSEEYDNFNIVLNGSYKGVGIEIAQGNDNKLYIIGIISSSPAAQAGLMAGDIIIGLNDKDVSNCSAKEFSSLVSSIEGDTLIIKVIRNDEEKEFAVSKKKVNLTSVASEIFERNNHKIGYIYISIFAANSASQFADELAKLEEQGIDSLIIDVRSNNGGHLSTAEKIASLFIDNNHTIYKLSKNKEVTEYKSTGKENKKYPIVVITNGSSASASELLTGCLKDNLNATVVGTKTFGKGSVQEVVHLSNGDQYKITTKEWMTPNGTKINGIGIAPDIEVELNVEYALNPSNETDNQLQAAIDYLAK